MEFIEELLQKGCRCIPIERVRQLTSEITIWMNRDTVDDTEYKINLSDDYIAYGVWRSGAYDDVGDPIPAYGVLSAS